MTHLEKEARGRDMVTNEATQSMRGSPAPDRAAPSPLRPLQELLAAATGLGIALFDSVGRRLGDPVAPALPAPEAFLRALDEGPSLVERAAGFALIGRVGLNGDSFLVAPLRGHDQVLGALVAGPLEGAKLRIAGEEAARVERQMLSLAQAVAGEMARASSQDRNVALLTALHGIGTKLTSNLDPRAVLRDVIETATSLLGARNASIMLLDPTGQYLRIAIARGLSEDVIGSARVPIGEGIAGWVAMTGRPRLIQEGVRDEMSRSHGERRSALSVPLKARGQVIGVLNVSERGGGGSFDESDLSLLLMLASQAAIAIDNARLLEEQTRKLQELAALFEVGRALTSSLERDHTLRVVLQCAMDLLAARHGSLMLVDDTGRFLEIVAAKGLSDAIVRHARPRVGEGIAGLVAQTGEPILLHKGQRFPDADRDSEAPPATISVPIRRKHRVIGVLNVRDRTDGGDFTPDDLELLVHLSSQAAVAIDNATLHQNLHDLFMGTVEALASAIDARDPYTERHSARVGAYSVAIGRHLGLSEERLDRLQIAALLHDIGKISIRDHILLKPGRLSEDEYSAIREHPAAGARIMRAVESLRPMLPFMYYHHERYGEAGYPEGIQGEEIPLEARIIAVADVFDAMTTDRPYRRALTPAVAARELGRCAGTQLDPVIVYAFLDLLAHGEVAVDAA